MINFQILKNFYIKIILSLYTIHAFAIEMYKIINGMSQEIKNEVFKQHP